MCDNINIALLTKDLGKVGLHLLNNNILISHDGASEFYRFIILYQNYMTNSHDYGDGVPHSMVEMHILTLICDNPGITVGQVAESWGCTKGAASQNITKLEKKGLLVRTKLLNNAREVHIYPTEMGHKLSTSHKEYDRNVETSFSEKLLERCSIAELENFSKIMNLYSDIVEEEMREFKK